MNEVVVYMRKLCVFIILIIITPANETVIEK